jgi:hypothetical protein
MGCSAQSAGNYPAQPNGTRILVEGPTWGDAEFYGRWLLEADFWIRQRDTIRFSVRQLIRLR